MSEIAEVVSRRDRDARRGAILDAAEKVFLEEGFAAASMSAIAALVGGSKGTLYNYFKSKETLFEAYVQRHCAWQQEAMFALLTPESGIRDALMHFGRSYLSSVLSEFSLRNFRLVVAEAPRAPEIGQAFYQAGPLSGVARQALSTNRFGVSRPSLSATLRTKPFGSSASLSPGYAQRTEPSSGSFAKLAAARCCSGTKALRYSS